MKHINMNFTLRKTIRLSRQCLAKGNIRPLLRRNRLLGLLWMVVGGCFTALVILFALHPKNGVESYTLFKNISVVLRLLPPSVLFVYGAICLIYPKFCGNYRSHYKKLEKTVRHNTGYPQKQYIPEEWEIPFTVYSPEALANILNLVGGWGQDNAFFLCNRVLRTTHRRHLEEAFLFNMCEKGIYLIPIGMDKGVPKAYADLVIVIPTESIKEFYGYDSEYPQSSSRGFTITTKCPMWDMFSRLFYRTDVMVFRVTARIHVDNAPFHDFNVNKLYQMYYVPYSYETIGYDPNKKKKGYDIPSFFKTPKTNTAKILNDTQNSRPSDMICKKIVSDGFLLIILHSLQFIRSGGGFVTWDFSFCNFYVLRQPSEFSLYSQVSAPGYFVVQK